MCKITGIKKYFWPEQCILDYTENIIFIYERYVIFIIQGSHQETGSKKVKKVTFKKKKVTNWKKKKKWPKCR